MRSCACAGVALAAACQCGAASSAAQAVIVDANDAARAELSQVVSDALGGRPVLLAADALTQSSELFIERTARSGPLGVRVPGRDMEPAQRFRLLSEGGRCVLVHVNADVTYALRRVQCRPVGENQ